MGVMATLREELESELSPQQHRPIELLTENGFAIERRWETEKAPPPVEGTYRFLVHPEDRLAAPREIVVEVSGAAVAEINRSTRGRITLASSFWIYCAERHLATFLWEYDDYPPEDRLRIDPLTPEDLVQAMRWERT